MRGEPHQLVETMRANGATRDEVSQALKERFPEPVVSRQWRFKLLNAFFGPARNPAPPLRTTLAAVDPEWRVYGGTVPFAFSFADLPPHGLGEPCRPIVRDPRRNARA